MRMEHFIHLNINSLLSKIDEIRCIAKLTNATVIGLSKTKVTTQFWVVNLKQKYKIWQDLTDPEEKEV